MNTQKIYTWELQEADVMELTTNELEMIDGGLKMYEEAGAVLMGVGAALGIGGLIGVASFNPVAMAVGVVVAAVGLGIFLLGILITGLGNLFGWH